MKEKFLRFIEKSIDAWFAFWPRKQPGKKQMEHAHLIAHRGAHDTELNIIENTDAAFQRAEQLGCWGIELDIHACNDKVLIVNHDPTLLRLWGQNYKISELAYAELHDLAPQVPTLAEVVNKYGKRMHLFIEIKTPFTAIAELQETIKSLIPILDYHLISLDEDLLPKLTPYFPKAALLLVPLHNNVGRFCKLSLQNQYGGVLGHHLLLCDSWAKKLIAANQMVGVGFVDSKNSLYRELNRGFHYVFSNNVGNVSTYLSSR